MGWLCDFKHIFSKEELCLSRGKVLTGIEFLLTWGPKRKVKRRASAKRGKTESKDFTRTYLSCVSVKYCLSSDRERKITKARLRRVSFTASCHRNYWKLNKAVSSGSCYQLAGSHFPCWNNCHMNSVHYLWACWSQTQEVAGERCTEQTALRPHALLVRFCCTKWSDSGRQNIWGNLA